MSKTFGYYLRISIKDLVSSIMVNDDKTEIRTDELYDLFLKTTYKMKQKGIDGQVDYSREYIKEFKYDNEEFDVGVGYIRLRDGYSIDWLQQNIIPYISTDKLQLLGLIPYDNEFSL